MTESRYLSTAQAASALRVSVTTVKRWVDEGVLPAHKTAGGHRKILSGDVVRLVRGGKFPAGALDALLTETPPAGTCADLRRDALADRLFEALVDNNPQTVRAVILGCYQGGMSVAALADGVIAPAMRRVGAEWENGGLDVRHEHRGTQFCVAALYELKRSLEVTARQDRPVALGGAPGGDFYILPSLLAEILLLDQGWQPINLGPNTPMAEFCHGLVEWRPALVWISVSHVEETGRFITEYHDLYARAVRAGVAVVLGGNGLTPAVRAGMRCTMFGDGLAALAEFAAGLCPGPQRPKRGRPVVRDESISGPASPAAGGGREDHPGAPEIET